MRSSILASLLVFAICQTKAIIPVSFPSEYIDFKIDSNYFSVNGIYVFKNKTGKEVNIHIQFPFGVNTALIDSIRVLNLKNMRNIHFRKNEQGISFYLELLPYDSVEYNIFYRQKLAIKNVYILTTTKSWGAPLENAVYNLTVNKSIKIISFSLAPDSSKTDLGNITYYWHKKNFLPQTDFDVEIDK
jgi:hypothetical protein